MTDRVNKKHLTNKCPDCEEGLCAINFFDGIFKEIKKLQPDLKLHLKMKKNYLWDGKYKYTSLY